MKTYEFRHIVLFDETNLVGNTYFTSHFHWQGRCREMFLHDHCPEVVQALAGDLRLVTVHCSCDYIFETTAFDELIIRMRLGGLAQNRITMLFEYVVIRPGGVEQVFARGKQVVACMKAEGHTMSPAPIPPSFKAALDQYAE